MCLTFFFIAGLEEPQFVEFNGGFSQAQLDWFNDVLKFSDDNQEKVVVMGRWTWRIYAKWLRSKLMLVSRGKHSIVGMYVSGGVGE